MVDLFILFITATLVPWKDLSIGFFETATFL